MYTDMRENRAHSRSDAGSCRTSEEFGRYDSMLAAFAAMVRGETL